MNKTKRGSLATMLLLSLSACGGSSGEGTSPPPPPPPPITTSEAFQFLNQSTFGAMQGDIQDVINLRFESWIDQEIAKPTSLQLPHLLSLPRPEPVGMLHRDRVNIWFRNSINGSDQLRQRVAFALSEILVVSQNGALFDAPYSVADYYDKLALHAFGNFRDLLGVVTLHPAMGVYLSMLGNEKPNSTLNIRPDENYARELMQLFTIGLVELNLDGTAKTDGFGRPIPTYDQTIIEAFAHVFTGWNYAGETSFHQAVRNDNNQTQPMQLYPAFHDNAQKSLLNGMIVPASQTGGDDLRLALDNIFNHPNVGPFVAIRLIQRLVTSNPSPGYVSRVASIFNNNGFGVRGDLGAVVKAILLDDEARPSIHTESDGKLKEPLLRLTQLWRAYGAASQIDDFSRESYSYILGQGPLQASHVFNFFSPFFAPAGEIRNLGLVAPELQIATEYQNTLVTNSFFSFTFYWNSAWTDPEEDAVLIDISEEIDIAGETDLMIDMVVGKLLGGSISDTLRAEVVNMVELSQTASPDNPALWVSEAIYFVVTSPEFAYQR